MKTKVLKTIIILFLFLSQLSYAEDLNKITLLTQWKHQFQFAGYYVAKEKGFYKNQGLDVQIKEYEFGMDVATEVLNKKANFATGRSSLIINKANGDKVVLLSAIFQSSPNILLATKKSGIKTIKDFKNKRIMITGDAKNDLTFLSMMFSQKITPEDMIVQKHSFMLEDLVNNKTDLMASYISNEPFRLKESFNIDSTIFDPKDYGFDFYSDILFTHEDEIIKNPKMVKQFREASLKGWKYAFDNIEETVDIILNKYNTQNKSREALVYEGKELKKLAYYNTDELGKIEKNKLERIYESYKLMGQSKNGLNFESLIFKENKIKFSQKEQNFLSQKYSIKMCIDPDWMPFEEFDESGKFQGLSKDYFSIFQKHLNNKIRLVRTNNWSQTLEYIKSKECDIISLAMETKKRKEYMNFTVPYISVPLVLSAKTDVTFVNNFEQLKNKKVAIVKDYAFSEIIKNKYPNIKLIEVKNTKEGLKKVEKEEVFGFVGSIAEVSYETQKNFIGELKIAGKFDEKLQLSISVRNDEPILLDIFNKILSNIDKTKKEEILNKHMAIRYENRIDYSLFWKSLLIFIIIIASVLYWICSIRKAKQKAEALLSKLESAQKQLKDKNKELKFIAQTDKLTGLYNRVKLDRTLEKEFKRDQRFNHSFSVIILDIDDFKSINDTLGHQIGDKVLIDIAKVLLKNTREIDTVGRWGGEEFLIICPETELNGSRKLANMLRERIEKHIFPEAIQVTASLGISCYKKGQTIDNLISNADEALYKAKENGKNRVEYIL